MCCCCSCCCCCRPAAAADDDDDGGGGGGGDNGDDDNDNDDDQAMDDLAFCGFRMYDEHHQPWGSVPEYFAQGVLMGRLSGGQRHLV